MNIQLTKKQKGILFIILSAFCFSLMNLFVKLAGDLPTVEKSFFRNLVAVFVAIFMMRRQHVSFICEKKYYPLLTVRSAVGLIGILGNFYAISRLNLADASMLNKLSPFFVILFSFLFLKEKITSFQGTCVILAFIGSLFIIKPGFAFSEPLAPLLGFLGGLCAGAAYTAVRALSVKGLKGTYIVFFFSAFSCIATLPYLLFSYAPMTWTQFASLMLAGLAASGGQFGITAAYANAPAGEISIYDYTIIIFSGIWSLLLWGDIPDWLSLTGYGIIFAASFAMFLNNKKS